MAEDQSVGGSSELISAPTQLSLPLPYAPSIRIHLHLTVQRTNTVLFLTTSETDAAPTSCPLGSFVYAIPNRNPSSPPLTTPLYSQTRTLDLATRMASTIARKTGKPAYVGNSMSFAGAGRGGDADEEIAGFKRIVDVVMAEIEKSDAAKMVNGT
ncbi:uncharacterized protein PV09_08649 [Verruconis gallopava]|uniref:Proteasome assembly chaperone 3 n=1 Tax=Verruconis gallopava TaxID=253628 RepID=A0A0D2A075_9PEZI|nr:uncharacterized protein PV09_08649 [Verruconis gallopava]KIV99719.1 hypothetical protein PV09_08649 [Verruconis gallopava]